MNRMVVLIIVDMGRDEDEDRRPTESCIGEDKHSPLQVCPDDDDDNLPQSLYHLRLYFNII